MNREEIDRIEGTEVGFWLKEVAGQLAEMNYWLANIAGTLGELSDFGVKTIKEDADPR